MGRPLEGRLDQDHRQPGRRAEGPKGQRLGLGFQVWVQKALDPLNRLHKPHALQFHASRPTLYGLEMHLAHMHERLASVVVEYFEFEHYVDDNMRNIPDHYHAHARPKGGFFGHHLRKKPQ